MKYMLLMLGEPAEDEDEGPAAATAVTSADPAGTPEPCWLPWHQEMTARGVGLLDGAQLQPASTATTIAVSDGEVLLSDGPFAETKEQIIGYDVIDVADLDEAVYVASRHPVAGQGGRIEIRPLLDEQPPRSDRR
jgi:hypothetical protein